MLKALLTVLCMTWLCLEQVIAQGVTLFTLPQSDLHRGAIYSHTEGDNVINLRYSLQVENPFTELLAMKELNDSILLGVGKYWDAGDPAFFVLNTHTSHLNILHRFSERWTEFAPEIYPGEEGEYFVVFWHHMVDKALKVYRYQADSMLIRPYMEVDSSQIGGWPTLRLAYDAQGMDLYTSSGSTKLYPSGFLYSIDLKAKSMEVHKDFKDLDTLPVNLFSLVYENGSGLYGLYGGQQYHEEGSIIFRLHQGQFQTVFDFRGTGKRGRQAIAFCQGKLLGVCRDTIKYNSNWYLIDTATETIKWFALTPDIGLKGFSALMTKLTDSSVLMTVIDGGIWGCGSLSEIYPESEEIKLLHSLDDSIGQNPIKLIPTQDGSGFALENDWGGTGTFGTVMHFTPGQGLTKKMNLFGSPQGNELSSSLVHIGSDRLALLGVYGGSYGKGVLTLLKYPEFTVDTIISIGSKIPNDTVGHFPVGKSLMAVDDTTLAFLCGEYGNPMGRGIMLARLGSKNDMHFIQGPLDKDWRPTGVISRMDSVTLLFWFVGAYLDINDGEKILYSYNLINGKFDSLFKMDDAWYNKIEDRKFIMSNDFLWTIKRDFPSSALIRFEPVSKQIQQIDIVHSAGRYHEGNQLMLPDGRIVFVEQSLDNLPAYLTFFNPLNNTFERSTIPIGEVEVPIGHMVYDEGISSLFLLTVDKKLADEGRLLRYVLSSNTWEILADLPTNTGYTSYQDHTPQLLRFNRFPLSLEGIDKKEMVCYPNPTSTQVTIKMPDPFDEDAAIMLYDMNGRLVFEAILKAGETTFIIPVEQEAIGLYLLSVRNNTWQRTEKIQIVR